MVIRVKTKKKKTTMKKIYKNPEIKMVKVQTAQMIATSTVEMYGTNANSAGMSRDGGSFWDDDEEDY